MKHRILAALGRRLRDHVARRPPDFVLTREPVIGTAEGHVAGGASVYMKRWYVLPRNRWLCLYLHKFEGSDEDRALHDHPARNISLIIDGGYMEHCGYRDWNGGLQSRVKFRSAGDFVTRPATALHRIELHKDVGIGGETVELPCWTLFVFLHKYRKWGFACGEHGETWIPWEDFDARGGCGEYDDPVRA